MARNVCKCQKITHIFVTLYITQKKIHMKTIKKENKLNLKFYIHQTTLYVTSWWLSTTNNEKICTLPHETWYGIVFAFFATLLCPILKKNQKALWRRKNQNVPILVRMLFLWRLEEKVYSSESPILKIHHKTTKTFELRQKLSACGWVECVWRR